MYIAKFAGKTVEPGTLVEVVEAPSLSFELLEVSADSLKIKWLNGSESDPVITVPPTVFDGLFDIEIIEISDDELDPNRAFFISKHA